MQLVVCASQVSRIENGHGAASEKLGAACSLCNGQLVETADEFVV